MKNFSSAGEAEKAAGKLIAEKTKKGYVETLEEIAKEMKVEAKKYALSYDEAEEGVNLMDKILKDKKLPSLKQITIGCWGYDGEDSSVIADGLLNCNMTSPRYLLIFKVLQKVSYSSRNSSGIISLSVTILSTYPMSFILSGPSTDVFNIFS